MLADQRQSCDKLKEDVHATHQSFLELQSEQTTLQDSVASDLRQNILTFWEFAQTQMSEDRNREVALTREVAKLESEVKAVQREIEQSEFVIRQLEKSCGIKY